MNADKAKAIYWGSMPLPKGAVSLGKYTRNTGESGCLIKLASGIKVIGNAGSIKSIPIR